MPELPDITIYIEALEARLLNQPLEKIRLASPFLLRSFEPPIGDAEGKKILGFQRIGKRIVFELEDDLLLVFHLMITGRFHWKKRGSAVPRKFGHAAFDFPSGTLLLTEMGTKKRASLHLVKGRENLIEHDPGGLEVFAADLNAFRAALTRENHTLKRTLTDPHLFSGIGNAYSDEILHRAKLSPVKQTKQLSDGEIETLATTAATAGRYFLTSDPKWLALTLFSMAVLTTYGTRGLMALQLHKKEHPKKE